MISQEAIKDTSCIFFHMEKISGKWEKGLNYHNRPLDSEERQLYSEAVSDCQAPHPQDLSRFLIMTLFFQSLNTIHDHNWSALPRKASRTSHWTEMLGQTQDPQERLYLTVGLEISGDPPGGAGVCFRV